VAGGSVGDKSPLHSVKARFRCKIPRSVRSNSVRYSVGVKFSIPVGLLAFSLLNGASGQLVSLRPERESLKEYCERVEPLRPNLILQEDTQITGRITDQSTEPFRESGIELRRFVSATKQVVLKKLATDDEGNFNLGVVRRGNYRLLLSNSRAFRQPETLTCWGKKCTLETILVVNPTDEPTTNCPIR
jgi:hypothetical protein